MFMSIMDITEMFKIKHMFKFKLTDYIVDRKMYDYVLKLRSEYER